jgi:transposase
MSQAQSLLAGLRPQYVVADKGYDCNWLRDEIRAQGARPVIPSRRGRFRKRRHDRTRYKLRNVVERFFNRLKHFRRIATRYDKTDANYQGFLCLAALMITIN